MQPKSDQRFNEPDDGTWQGPPPGSAPSGGKTLDEPKPGSIGISTPTPGPSVDSHDGDDFEDSTPKPEMGRSDDWDLLPPPLIAEGNEVFGKYRLIQKIGEGGMGEVWLVDDLELDRKCALKLVKPEIAQNEKGWRRFRREARLMAKLDHPNAVAVHGFKRAHSMGYIEMEFVRGKSLDKFINERGTEHLPLDRIVTILDQLCAVLQEAHGHVDEKSGKPAPIIHRDLKPSNIMLVDRKPPGQDLKVLDFGIAKMMEEDGGQDATLTGAGDFLGTPAFMSPEQIRGGWGKDAHREVDARSDLYSVGVLLYQLITGKLPFRGRDARAMMAANLAEQPRPMKEANPEVNVPPAVERVVMQCLEKDPAKRPQSAQELARLFREAAGRSRPRRTWWLAIVAACVAVGMAAGLLPLVKRFSQSSAAKPPIPSPPEPGPAQPPTARVPRGYKAFDPNEIAENSDEPVQIERIEDGVIFRRHRAGIYLPLEYEPESQDWSDQVGGWPRVIIRKPDNARFIRIPAGTYRRGDPRPNVDLDFLGKPIAPHWVRVSAYFIQENEVTNGEIEAYLAAHPEDADLLQKWKQFYTETKRKIEPKERALHLPASCISYLAARKFAREMRGRLPTEAEWEFTAKSCDSEYLFPWGKGPPAPPRQRPRANIINPFGNLPIQGLALAEVKTFPEDQTEQHVFDMAGNVSELCLDAYKPYAELIPQGNSKSQPLDNPCFRIEPGPDQTSKFQVVRGGSILSTEKKARAFYRFGVRADESPPEIGFRLVIECPPETDRPG